MLTPEEERELELLELRELEAREAASQAPQQAEAAPGYDESNRFRDQLAMAAQGATLGFGDEIASMGSALGREVGSWVGLADDADVMDRYNQRQAESRANREAYREAHPVEAITTEIGGGFLTGGLGAGRAAAAVGARSLGGRLLQKAAARRAQQPGIVSATRRAATEGAIAGIGGAEGGLEERLQGAGTGAAFGGVMGAGLGGLGRLGRVVSDNRTGGQSMGRVQDGDFRPLNMVNDTGLGAFYRNFIGRTYGGGDKLRAQGKQWVDAAKDEVTESRAGLVAARDARAQSEMGATRRAEDFARGYKEERLAPLAREADEISGNLAKAADDLDARLIDIDQQAARAKKGLGEVEPQARAAVERDVDSFRRATARESLPESAGKLRDDIVDMEPLEARDAINRWWRKDGFREVKNETYDWGASKGVQDNLRTLLSENPDMVLEVGDVFEKVPALAARMQKAALRGGKASGTELSIGDMVKVLSEPTGISGDAFMGLRNTFAKAANKSRNQAGRRVVKEFDRVIEDRLLQTGGEEAVDRFRDQLTRYGDSRTFDGAVRSSFKDRGRFTPDSWLTNTKIMNPDRATSQAAWRSREQAQRGLEKAKAAVTTGREEVADQVKVLKRAAKKDVKKETRKLKKAKARLAEAQAEVKERATRWKKVKKQRDPRLRAAKRRVRASEATMAGSKERLMDVVRSDVPGNTSGLSTFLSTEELAGIVTPRSSNPLTNFAVNLPLGSRIGEIMAREGVQRALGGDYLAQRVLSEALRKGTPVTRDITGAVARTGALESTSGDR